MLRGSTVLKGAAERHNTPHEAGPETPSPGAAGSPAAALGRGKRGWSRRWWWQQVWGPRGRPRWLWARRQGINWRLQDIWLPSALVLCGRTKILLCGLLRSWLNSGWEGDQQRCPYKEAEKAKKTQTHTPPCLERRWMTREKGEKQQVSVCAYVCLCVCIRKRRW